MAFSSFSFIFVFLPVVLLGFYLLPRLKLQLTFLLISSIVFYCYWSPAFSLLMLFTVCFDFFIARAISEATSTRTKRVLLTLSIGTNLTILGFFKYYGFFAQTLNGILFPLAHGDLLPALRMVLPIGISFYTFQSMSYVIDVYRGDAEAHSKLLPFAGYVTMFPHQISGPLVRHNVIVPQLKNPKTYFFSIDSFWTGCFFFMLGLSKKILIADRLGVVVNTIIMEMAHASKLEAILAMLGYTMQLYFDFSGYCDMAVGLGYMLNIRFPQNFNSPYKSRSITEFWRRWHITLSSWLKDYLYISLGGNRKGASRTYFNVLLTMLIGGLWHGANWTFVFWGFLHGCALSVERFFKRSPDGLPLLPSWLRWALTFGFINIGWVFFRAPNFKTAFLWLRKIFGAHLARTWDIKAIAAGNQSRFFLALVLSVLIALLGKNTFELKMKPSVRNALTLGALFGLCLMYLHEESPFLYFQF